MPKGKFIVIEGGEGSGKDTQIELLQKALSGKNVVFTREPGGSDVGMRIRSIVQDPELTISPVADLLLYYADRAEHLELVIKPALNEGKHVVSNRFSLSTIAYQIYGRERHQLLDFLQILDKEVVAEFQPDLTILLDCPPEIGLERIHKRMDKTTRFESEKLAFHRKVREGYLQNLPELGRGLLINAKGAINDVHGQIIKAIEEILK
jgi:dTMP kinase